MDTKDTPIADSEVMHRFHDAAGAGAMLFDRASLPHATPALFDPDNATLDAHPVAVGGRGAAWFVRTDAGDAVLRHYRRGGVVAKFSRENYLWQGAERTRCFREFHLLRKLHEQGLPVPIPLAAAYWRSGTGYRAALLMQRLSDTQSLGALLDRGETLPWRDLGRTLARFHRAGASHADLNVDNVLMDAQDKLWLIDFDRGTLRSPATGWQQANMARLWRSLRKRLGKRAQGEDVMAGWNVLRTEYGDAMQEPA